MKIVNAIWEKRNLGLYCNELTIETEDTVETIERDVPKYEKEYTVVKIPTGQVELVYSLQKLGFVFIETLTTCYHTGEHFNLNRIQQRILDQVKYIKMHSPDIDFLFNEIKRGIFTTDRISVDPYFTAEQANNRYVYWLKDELNKGSLVYKLTYGDKDIGFFTLKRTSASEFFAFLSGNYSEYLFSGFGFCAHYFEVTEAIRLGAKRVMTSFSSNNRGAASIHFSMGHILHKQYYVFVKHR